jgi:hypothetical protein
MSLSEINRSLRFFYVRREAIWRRELERDVAAFFIAVIALVGVPFLLFCLWNLLREMKPRTTKRG